MDWIRRNWPDLLIGFALLAVISGIVATLLTGGSFFPLGGGGNDSPRPAATQTQGSGQQPQTPFSNQAGQLQDPASANGPQVADLPLLSQTPPPADPAATDSLADGPVDPFADLQDPQELPTVVALRPGADNSQTQPVQPQQPSQPPAAQPDGQPAQTQAPVAAPVQTTPGAAPQAQPPSSGQAPSASVPYTVGVGAFRDAANAERQANIFRQAGYAVVVAAQDDLTVVLLGPYAAQTEAERVRNAVASGGFDVAPIVYTYQGEDDGQQTSAAATQSPPVALVTSTPGSIAPSPPPEAAPTATAASRYLQVGAYSSAENASAQAGVLAGLGFSVVQQQDGNLIRVLVGPYPEGQLTDARNRLAAQGIDSVPR